MKKKYFYFLVLLFTSISFSQIINFPDANFKAKLLQADVTNTIAQDATQNNIKIDTNNNNEVEVNEALTIYNLTISNSNISNLSGIENFSNLSFLDCSYNNLTSLNVNTLNLYVISASHNTISSYQLNWNYLQDINLSYNQLTNFTITSSTNNYHEYVNLSHNNITNLLFENNVINIDVSYNNLSSIQANGSVFLGGSDGSHQLNFSNNNFSLLDFETPNINLFGTLIIGNNTIDKVKFKENAQPVNITYTSNNTSLDLGNFKATTTCDPEYEGNLTISNSPNLQNIILKNGFNHTEITCVDSGTFQIPALNLQISNCPNLNYICVDEGEQLYVQNRINQLNLQNQIQVNSYCSFSPGGTFYTLNGTTSLNHSNNNCGSGSFGAQNIKYAINDGTTTNHFFGNASGNYSLPVAAGTYTITPILDNPNNYIISPANYTVTFPTQSSPFTQDFCIKKNTSVLAYSLKTIITPLTQAIPGFNSTYRICVKNTGNILLFGDVELNFNDAIMDYVSSTQTPLEISNGFIKWNFVLGFLEEKYIDVTFNLNTPIETPALNAGDVLSFTSEIISNAIPYGCGDTFVLNQTVINSLDPNDKTCLLGDDINPTMIGDYVPYQIRFENSGTSPAQNIVVKDIIDPTKFDVSTLQIISASHFVKTKITGNKIEFIFENINLPFDDANNDGFVIFKLKSLPTLAVNDVISNQASIYFDYNFPIATNIATSTYHILSSETFINSNAIKIYPIPSKDNLNIINEVSKEITSIEIYNALGQLIQKEIGNRTQIDVSKLKTGNYFLKIKTTENQYTKQFIKE